MPHSATQCHIVPQCQKNKVYEKHMYFNFFALHRNSATQCHIVPQEKNKIHQKHNVFNFCFIQEQCHIVPHSATIKNKIHQKHNVFQFLLYTGIVPHSATQCHNAKKNTKIFKKNFFLFFLSYTQCHIVPHSATQCHNAKKNLIYQKHKPYKKND